MSPELRAEFEALWPALSARLDRFLANRNVSPCKRDDVIQETAIRLFGIWTTVDRTRSPWPLTITIALNLVRDESRSARNRELYGELPETAGPHHVETSGLARIELARVAEALEALPKLQRAALMREIGINGTAFTTREAEKMLRLRARKRLRSILERVSGILVLRPRRDPADLNTVLMARDGLTQVATCFACAVLGIAAGVVPGFVSPPSAKASVPRASAVDRTFVPSVKQTDAHTIVPRAAQAAAERHASNESGRRSAGSRDAAPKEAGSVEQVATPAAMPLPEDAPLQPPTVEPPGVEPPGAEPPPLPSLPPVTPPGNGDAPLVPGELVDALGTAS